MVKSNQFNELVKRVNYINDKVTKIETNQKWQMGLSISIIVILIGMILKSFVG